MEKIYLILQFLCPGENYCRQLLLFLQYKIHKRTQNKNTHNTTKKIQNFNSLTKSEKRKEKKERKKWYIIILHV